LIAGAAGLAAAALPRAAAGQLFTPTCKQTDKRPAVKPGKPWVKQACRTYNVVGEYGSGIWTSPTRLLNWTQRKGVVYRREINTNPGGAIAVRTAEIACTFNRGASGAPYTNWRAVGVALHPANLNQALLIGELMDTYDGGEYRAEWWATSTDQGRVWTIGGPVVLPDVPVAPVWQATSGLAWLPDGRRIWMTPGAGAPTRVNVYESRDGRTWSLLAANVWPWSEDTAQFLSLAVTPAAWHAVALNAWHQQNSLRRVRHAVSTDGGRSWRKRYNDIATGSGPFAMVGNSELKAPIISAHPDGVLAGWYGGQVAWRHAAP
jgi:hypothetical protein